MNLSQRLRTCAKHTGLDAVIELLNEAADEIERLSATQPAEVTDEQIAACVKRASTYGLPFVGLLNPGGTPSDFSKRFTVEILALRPVQAPMAEGTARQFVEWMKAQPEDREPTTIDGALCEFEAHHGISIDKEPRYDRQKA